MTDFSHSNPLVAPDAIRQWLDELPLPVAVTGGTGFIGSHLVDALCAAGIEPRVLVRTHRTPRWISTAPVRWIEGSLADQAALERLVEGAGTVLHLAGIVRAGRRAVFDEGNRAGTERLVAAVDARARSSRLVAVSSLAAVGPSPTPEGSGPDADPAPISDYGRSKLAAERAARRRGGWWSIVRPPAVFGPRDSDVYEFFRMADRGVVVVPRGARWLTVAWVGDVVRSILAAATGSNSRVYHIGSAAPVRLQDLLAALCEAGGVQARVIAVPGAFVFGAGALGSLLQGVGWPRVSLTRDKARELVARHWTARTDDSMAILGVEPQPSFADAAAVTWSWYRLQGWIGR